MKRYLMLVLFVISVSWITLNVYLLPFHVWTVGVVYPWFITRGLTLYKDVIWIRMPLDMFLLSGWYRLFGASGSSYQAFIWTLFVILSASMLIFLPKIDKRIGIPAYCFFLVFLYPLFLNVEVGELLVGILMFLLFVCGHIYLSKGSLVWLLVTGFVAGLVITTKQNTVFITVVLPLMILWQIFQKKVTLIEGVRRGLLYGAGVLLPFTGFIIYFFSRRGLYDFFYSSLYIAIGPYRSFQLLFRGDGQFIELAYGLLIIPFVLCWKQLGIKKETVVWLVLLIVALIPSLLPSYLSYRTFTSFALASIAVGYTLWALFAKKQLPFMKMIIMLSFVGFGALTLRYTRAYVDFVRDNGVAQGQYLTDYGLVEQEFADWITHNTAAEDRIMVWGSEMIYLFSNRLPQNKYTNFTPFVLQPYEESTKIFADDPPRVIVFDWSHPDMPKLSDWPFLLYMKENYQEIKHVDDLVLYALKK